MEKIICWGCIFMMLCTVGIRAQDLDSLINAIQYHKTDTNKVWLLRDIAYWWQSTEPDSAIVYSERGFELARSLEFPGGQIWNLYQKGLALENTNRLDEAFDTYEQALQIARDHSDMKSVAKLYNAMGVAHYYAGDFMNAVKYYKLGYEFSDSLSYGEGTAFALNNLGVIYRLQERHEKALEIYGKSLHLKQERGDSAGIVNTLYNIGLAYTHLDRPQQSLNVLKQAEEMASRLSNPSLDLANINIGIGTVHYYYGEYDEAAEYLIKGKEEVPLNSQEWIEASTFLGVIELNKGRFDNGLELIEMAWEQAKISGRKVLQKNVLQERALAGEKTGNLDLALESWKFYNQLADSLNQVSVLWAQEEMQAKFELLEKEATISLQNLTLAKESTRKQLYLFSGILMLTLFISSAGFLVWIWKQRNRLKREVRFKEQALKDNDLLMQEMHHRTKNNLQMLNSLLNIKSRAAKDPETRNALQSSRETVGAIGLLHHHLYRSKEFRLVAMRDYINDLCESFQSAFHMAKRGIQLDFRCEDFDLDMDRAIPFGLIINELLTNAILHGFPDERRGCINLEITVTEEQVNMWVRDDGVGLPEHYSKKGTGNHLIDLLAKKLKGSFRYESASPGCTAAFIMPMQKIEPYEKPAHIGRGR